MVGVKARTCINTINLSLGNSKGSFSSTFKLADLFDKPTDPPQYFDSANNTVKMVDSFITLVGYKSITPEAGMSSLIGGVNLDQKTTDLHIKPYDKDGKHGILLKIKDNE